MVTSEQQKELLKPIDPARVSKDGKGFSHVEAWDIRRTMNRIFGFGNWSADVTEMHLVAEREVTTKQGKPAFNVVYRARCSLRVGEVLDGGASFTEWAAGDATNPTLADAHDQAIKTAESQAFKRCAVNLGDQFGLSLYQNGSVAATVGEVVGMEHADSALVPELLTEFEEALDSEDLALTAQRIATLDLGSGDKEILRRAYGAAKQRVEGGTGA